MRRGEEVHAQQTGVLEEENEHSSEWHKYVFLRTSKFLIVTQARKGSVLSRGTTPVKG